MPAAPPGPSAGEHQTRSAVSWRHAGSRRKGGASGSLGVRGAGTARMARPCEPKIATPSSVTAGAAPTVPAVTARAVSRGVVVLTRKRLRPEWVQSTWSSDETPGRVIAGGSGGGGGGSFATGGATGAGAGAGGALASAGERDGGSTQAPWTHTRGPLQSTSRPQPTGARAGAGRQPARASDEASARCERASGRRAIGRSYFPLSVGSDGLM